LKILVIAHPLSLLVVRRHSHTIVTRKKTNFKISVQFKKNVVSNKNIKIRI